MADRGSGPADLGAPVLGLPGVGPRTAERLAAAGVRTRGDLLELVPRRWDDLRDLTPVRELKAGAVQVVAAEVTSSRFLFGRRRSLEVRLRGLDGTGRVVARWFVARGSMKDRFAPGTRWLLSAMVREHRAEKVMAHPETRALGEAGEGAEGDVTTPGVIARYPELDEVPARVVMTAARAVAAACAAIPEVEGGLVVDGLPPSLRQRHGFPSRGAALALLHAVGEAGRVPSVEEVRELNEGRHPAQRRLAYDELFFLQLGLLRRRAELSVVAAPAVGSPGDPWSALGPLLSSLTFAPTAAQRHALVEIAADLARPHPMHRLLQGDVGAGKTLVMFAAAELAMAAGFQVAVMAPTELLAEQHARTLAPWARALGRRLRLLTASTPRVDREATLAALASPGPDAARIDLVIGTHALLGDRVAFARLGLVIVDEQHRFGVAQRAALREKGAGLTPHLLVMTATPIPRTLALTAWGDLEVTTLDELPPGRTPPTTRVLLGKRGRARAFAQLLEALEAGRQGFVVCPRIEGDRDPADDPDADAAGAVATFDRLCREWPGLAIGLVHGRLPAAERDAAMRAFAGGETRLLVATTVIEVGVDVPAADVLLVDGAERFGLAQLHQLRGRIGRAPARSAAAPRPLCLLVSDADADSDSARRLEVLAETTDGFAIAEADLAARGPGQLFGTRQAGLPRMRFADLRHDLALLRHARQDASDLLAADPELERPEHATTGRVLAERWTSNDVFAEEAG